MNKGNIIGNLTRDPELRFIPSSGKAVCTFTIAVNRPMSKDAVDFLPIKVWGKTAENCGKYLSKGSKVGVTGSATSGSYEDKEGNKVYTIDVLAYNVQFLNTKKSDDKQQSQPNYQNDLNGFQAIDGDSDIPF